MRVRSAVSKIAAIAVSAGLIVSGGLALPSSVGAVVDITADTAAPPVAIVPGWPRRVSFHLHRSAVQISGWLGQRERLRRSLRHTGAGPRTMEPRLPRVCLRRISNLPNGEGGGPPADRVTVPWEPFTPPILHPGDVLALQASALSAPTGDGNKCGGSEHASGLRVFYDSKHHPIGFLGDHHTESHYRYLYAL